MKINISKTAFIIALLFCHLLLSQELIDGIAAIVGDEIILYTEVLQTSQIYALQMGINPMNQVQEYNQLKEEILENLINDKIFLARAIEDTITVTDQQVETALDERIQGLVQQLGSEKEVEAYFGTSIRQIKKNYREDIRKLLIIETLKQQKSMDVKISRTEIEEYFNTQKDSLPQKRAMVKTRHILMQVQPGGLNRQTALQQIQEIQERLNLGEDFSELAKLYSEDPGTANIGGDLGFIKKGTLFESFEEAGFQLAPGQISDVVETPIGLHLIQMVEKQEDEAHMRHILIRMNITQQDESSVIDTLIHIRNRALSGEDFSKLANEYSQDESSKELGGDLGWLPVDDLEIPIFKSVVDTLQVG
ncbi:peptidylprolyl isomerase, partial [bacterium]|nr:peptidylprolyl isomerase [bacterium]